METDSYLKGLTNKFPVLILAQKFLQSHFQPRQQQPEIIVPFEIHFLYTEGI